LAQKTVSIIPLLLLALITRGQPLQDNTFIGTSVLNAEKSYHQAMGKQLNIYNGSGYKIYTQTDETHPYFLSDDWVMGKISYDTDNYTDVPIQYDLVDDKVIAENPVNGAKMQLASNKITRFEIEQHTFLRLTKDSTFAEDMSAGFYELLYNGHLKLYAQRKKELQKRIKENKLIYDFDEKNKYYLFNGKSYVRVTGKKSVRKALGDKNELPKPPGKKIDSNSTKKVEAKLIYLTAFYDSHTAAL
jgi:hypothetical protein